jgi:hypothetical protein
MGASRPSGAHPSGRFRPIADISSLRRLPGVKLSPSTKKVVFRTGNVVVVMWLCAVLLAYAGLFKLPAVLADAAALTVVVIVATMIWKYVLQPLFGPQIERS